MSAEQFKLVTNAQFKIYDDSPNGGFSGYGSVFGNYDHVKEAVAPDAFKNLDEFFSNGFIAIGHDQYSLPVASVKSVKPDDYGLHIEAEFHSTPEAQNARTVLRERLERGKSVGLSIGYKVNAYEPTSKGRILKDLSLYEISIVNQPANELAVVRGAKDISQAGMSFEDHTEHVLATATDYVQRLKSINDLRVKDNRTISTARRGDLLELKGLIDELVYLTEPKVEADKVRAIRARLLSDLLD